MLQAVTFEVLAESEQGKIVHICGKTDWLLIFTWNIFVSKHPKVYVSISQHISYFAKYCGIHWCGHKATVVGNYDAQGGPKKINAHYYNWNYYFNNNCKKRGQFSVFLLFSFKHAFKRGWAEAKPSLQVLILCRSHFKCGCFHKRKLLLRRIEKKVLK